VFKADNEKGAYAGLRKINNKIKMTFETQIEGKGAFEKKVFL